MVLAAFTASAYTNRMAVDPPSSPAASTALPAGLLLVLGTLWGLSFSLAKVAATGGVSPIAYTFWQAAGAGIVVTAICAARRLWPPLDRAHLRYYAAIGLLGIAIPNINLVFVITRLPAGVMVLAIPFVPLTTYIIVLGLRMERFDALRLSGVVFGLGGTALILFPDSSLPDAGSAPWFLLGLLTPIFYALSNVLAARLRPAGAHSLPLAAGMLWCVAIVLAPLVFSLGLFYPVFPPFETPELAILGQIAVSSVAYFLFFEIIRLAGPVFMSFTGYVVTLTGIGWGMVFFGESHSPFVWAAAGLIFVGMGLVNLRARAPAAPAAPAAAARPAAPSR